MKPLKLTLTINGRKHRLKIAPNLRLVDLLRDELRLTGTKEGCGVGECGACTVVLDGEAVNACLVLAGQCEGREVVTIEGMERGGELHPLQKAFIARGAVHCGFCTPGMIMSAYALLRKNPHPAPEEIARQIAGNLCRCTGYAQIVEAIRAAADRIAADQSESARMDPAWPGRKKTANLANLRE